MESIKNFITEGQATASTTNFRMTDEQVMRECEKYTDRVAVAVFRSEHATVIVSQLFLVDVTTGKPMNPYKEGFIPDVSSDGWPEG
jgi:hypothetical protein